MNFFVFYFHNILAIVLSFRDNRAYLVHMSLRKVTCLRFLIDFLLQYIPKPFFKMICSTKLRKIGRVQGIFNVLLYLTRTFGTGCATCPHVFYGGRGSYGSNWGRNRLSARGCLVLVYAVKKLCHNGCQATCGRGVGRTSFVRCRRILTILTRTCIGSADTGPCICPILTGMIPEPCKQGMIWGWHGPPHSNDAIFAPFAPVVKFHRPLCTINRVEMSKRVVVSTSLE